MSEKHRILLEKIVSALVVVFVIFLFLIEFYLIIEKPFSKTENLLLMTGIIVLIIAIELIRISSRESRFSNKILHSDVFEYSYKNNDELLKLIDENCIQNGYVYKKYLKTNLDEEFTLYTSDNNSFPEKKIGVYISHLYECECQSDWDPSSGEPSIVPGQGRFHFEYRPFLNMICDKWGRDYYRPRDWVDIETTIIVVVDEWNGMLNKVMNHGWHLPFVLFCVISKSEPNKLFIAKDNRKKKREDYYRKRNELFDILDVRNRFPIGEMKYTDCKEDFELVEYKKFKKVIEKRNDQGRYYI